MKRIICLVMVVGLLAVAGCQKNKPEDAARAFMNRQITAHQGLGLDTSGLKYNRVEETGDTAKVLISGDITVKAELNLVKIGGKWQVAEKGEGAKKQAEPAETGHQKAE